MKNKIFRKTMSLVLALAVILSAMSCLMFVSVSAAQNYDNLTKLYDFEDGSAADFIQVGGKTGNETAEGYTAWNYDPEVAEVTGLEKYTINKAEFDYANDATVKAVTRNALLAKPYLNQTEGVTDMLASTATSATAPTPYHYGNTSLYVLKDTVDENGVALDTIKKEKITGKFSMDFYEGAGKNTYNAMASSPIIVYYYKDANNWRGVRFNSYTITEVPTFTKLTYQNIICESREVEGEEVVYYYQASSGRSTASAEHSDSYMDATLYKNHVIDPSLLPEEPSWYNVMGRDKVESNVAGFPTVKNWYYESSVPAEKRYGEWLNFEVEYLDGGVNIIITDATGFPFQVFVSQYNSTLKVYDANGTGVAQTQNIDFASGTFAIGASFSLGNNTNRGADYAAVQPNGIAFDDIKAEMTDSSETSVASVISAIDAIADEAAYNTAKAAYANLTDSAKERVSNATALNKWEKYFAAKRISYDFSEDWHEDAFHFSWPSNVNTDSTKLGDYTGLDRHRIVENNGAKSLRISFGNAPYGGRQQIRTYLPQALISEIESISIRFNEVHDNDNFYSTNSPDSLTYFDANYQVAGRTKLTKILEDSASGLRYLGKVGWDNTLYYKLIDFNSPFEMILTPNGTTKTDITFKGTEMVDPDGDGVYEPGANTEYVTPAYTVSYTADKIGFAFCYTAVEIGAVDVKFAGWEEMVGLTAEEEALAARIVAIPEITINNYKDVNTEVSAIRAAVDALSSTGLADKAPEGSEQTYAELLAAAEVKIATFTGDVAKAQAFVDENNAVLNIAKANIDTTNAQSIIDVHTAYEALTDEVKSILANNYALLDNAATNTKFAFDVIANLKENYAIAIPLCPTDAQIAFLKHYDDDNKIGDFTSAEGKMAILEESIVLYNAVEETHKPNVQAKYEYILDLLDKHFIDGNNFTYNAADIKDYTNIYAYFTDTVFTESTIANDENRTVNNKIINPEKFDATSTTHFTLAQDHGAYNAAGTGYIIDYGFDLLPQVQSLSGIINPSLSSNCTWGGWLYKSTYIQSNKNTVYVYNATTGEYENVASSTDLKSVLLPFYCNSFTRTDTQQYVASGSNALIGTGAFVTPWTSSTSSPYVYDEATGIYRMPHSRIVYDGAYTVKYNPNYVGASGDTYTRVTITITNLTIWMEMEDDTTPYVYDEEEGSTDYLLGVNEGGAWSYTYAEDEIALPQLRIDDEGLKYTQYLAVTREDTFTDKYEDALDKTFTTDDAAEVIEIAKDVNNLSSSAKAINAEAVAKAEKAITDAGLRPVSKGSTLSVGANTSIGFIAAKPAVDTYSKFGIIVSTFNKMNTKGDTELTLADTAISKSYYKEYAEGDTRADELTFNVYGLFDAEVAEGVDAWAIWLVSRYYATYIAEDGTEVTVYSIQPFTDNTPTGSDDTENAMIQTITNNGQLIRSVNGIIKVMATSLYGAKETYKDEVGADYVDSTGATMTNYTNVSLATAYGDDTDGLLSTAKDTLYFMKAFKGVFTKMANS